MSCNSDCKTCLTDATCDSCIDGKYVSEGKCLDCNNLKCATCVTDQDTCIVDCNNDCLTCDSSADCTTCVDGRYLKDGACELCDKNKCATCVTD